MLLDQDSQGHIRHGKQNVLGQGQRPRNSSVHWFRNGEIISYCIRNEDNSMAELCRNIFFPSFIRSSPMYKCFDEIPIPRFFISSHSFTLFTLYCVDIGPYRMLEIDP